MILILPFCWALFHNFFSILRVGVCGTLWHDSADIHTNMDNYLVKMMRMMTVGNSSFLRSFFQRRTTWNVCRNTDRQLCLRSWQWTVLKLPNNQHRSLLVSASLKNITFHMWVCVCVCSDSSTSVIVCFQACCAEVTCDSQVWFDSQKREDGPEGAGWKIYEALTERVGPTPGAVLVSKTLTCAHGFVCTCTDRNSHELKWCLCVCVP